MYGAVVVIQDYFDDDKASEMNDQQLLNVKSSSDLHYAETEMDDSRSNFLVISLRFWGETGSASFMPKVYKDSHKPSIVFYDGL